MNTNYIYDLYIENYTYPINIFYKKEVIKNTVLFYKMNHPDFNVDAFNQLDINTLKQIVKYDNVITINKENIYKELYKILYLIDSTFEALKFINQPNYPRKYFANIQSNKKRVQSEIRSYKKLIIGNDSISSNGEIRLNWYFYNLFKKNKELSQFFMNLHTLVDFEKATFFYTENEDITKKFLHFYTHKLIQKTTKKAIIKSLTILLHYEFKNYLNLKDTQSKELIAEIIPYIFDEEAVNDEEFNSHVYLSSTLAFFPIFGATRKNPYTIKKQQDIRAMFIKILKSENYKTKINKRVLDKGIKELLEKPHIMFLEKYPVELLRINPKYSTLK